MENENLCKFCKIHQEGSLFWSTHTLYSIKEAEGYVQVNLDNIDNKNEEAAKLIVESGIGHKYNRIQFAINYCPMCGRKLGG